MKYSFMKIIRNVSFLITGNFLLSIIGFLNSILVTRLLGPSLYGVWAVIITFCAIINTICGFRTAEPLTKYIVEFEEKKKIGDIESLLKTSILVDFFTRVISLLLVVLLSVLISSTTVGEKSYVQLYWIYAFALVFTSLDNTWYCICRHKKKYWLLGLPPVILGLIQLVGTLMLYVLGYPNIYYYSYIILIGYLCNFLYYFLYLNREVYSIYGFKIFQFDIRNIINSQSSLIEFWKFMKVSYLASTISTITKNIDVLILAYFCADKEVGLYKLAKSLMGIVQQIGVSLSSVFYQDFNELISKKEVSTIVVYIKTAFRILLLPVIIGIIACNIWSQHVIALIYGVDYAKAADSLDILVISSGLSILFFWFQPLILSMGKYRQNLLIMISANIWTVAMNLILIPKFGQVGAAYALVSMWLVYFIGIYSLYNKLHQQIKQS